MTDTTSLSDEFIRLQREQSRLTDRRFARGKVFPLARKLRRRPVVHIRNLPWVLRQAQSNMSYGLAVHLRLKRDCPDRSHAFQPCCQQPAHRR